MAVPQPTTLDNNTAPPSELLIEDTLPIDVVIETPSEFTLPEAPISDIP